LRIAFSGGTSKDGKREKRCPDQRDKMGRKPSSAVFEGTEGAGDHKFWRGPESLWTGNLSIRSVQTASHYIQINP
jgi:hypothetical protein